MPGEIETNGQLEMLSVSFSAGRTGGGAIGKEAAASRTSRKCDAALLPCEHPQNSKIDKRPDHCSAGIERTYQRAHLITVFNPCNHPHRTKGCSGLLKTASRHAVTPSLPAGPSHVIGKMHATTRRRTGTPASDLLRYPPSVRNHGWYSSRHILPNFQLVGRVLSLPYSRISASCIQYALGPALTAPAEIFVNDGNPVFHGRLARQNLCTTRVPFQKSKDHRLETEGSPCA